MVHSHGPIRFHHVLHRKVPAVVEIVQRGQCKILAFVERGVPSQRAEQRRYDRFVRQVQVELWLLTFLPINGHHANSNTAAY